MKNVFGLSLKWRFSLLCGIALAASLSAYAGNLPMAYSGTFSGYSPGGTAPWVTSLFEDVSPGTVRLTISTAGLVGGENVDQLYFNLNPTLNVSSLQFALQGTTGMFDLPTINQGTDAYKAGGDGKFDIKLLFSTVGADTKRLTANESLVYNLTGIPTLSAADFFYLSTPASGNGPFLSVAHIQRIDTGSSGTQSGWVYSYVPEPSALSFALLGGCAWLCRRRIAKG